MRRRAHADARPWPRHRAGRQETHRPGRLRRVKRLRLLGKPAEGKDRPRFKLIQELQDDACTLRGFLDANPDPGIDIPCAADRHLEGNPVIRRIDKGPARIERPACRPPDIAAGCELPRIIRFDDARPSHAVLKRGRLIVGTHRPREGSLHARQQGMDRAGSLGRQIAGNTALERCGPSSAGARSKHPRCSRYPPG
jgi:hypothetical protein